MSCDLDNVCGGALPPSLGEGGTGSDFSCKVQGSTCMTSLGIEFHLFSERCTVDLEGLGDKIYSYLSRAMCAICT